MPTYQYACTNPEGKHEFEVVQSFSDAAVAECPECGTPVRKVYGSVGVVFKGSGFYRTDSRKSSSTSGNAGSSSSDGAASTAPAKEGSSSSASSTASSSTSSSGGGSTAKAAKAD
ncbi:FmdB family zinc ribbon protein [Blastococcus capsensis]|uniref:FmdB family zinc ribbon protein n=1 Tax=Blastococcus capsensis TaxID=1564163 RepID=UPI0025407F9D|nr:FmdB family zinc ribbon protein [Blastococcus capsensis]MDK3258808.1 zinc ribbon domain-containing protein [Blastococcus capsensis]